jgi:hypothetical protein
MAEANIINYTMDLSPETQPAPAGPRPSCQLQALPLLAGSAGTLSALVQQVAVSSSSMVGLAGPPV